MLTLFAVILSVACGALASPSVNHFVDTLITTYLEPEIRGLGFDHAPLPDYTADFKDKVLFIKVNGQANFTDGKLHGLGFATRNSECRGPSYSYGAAHINCSIAFDQLSSEHNARVKYGKLPKVTAHAKANITRTVLFVDFIRRPSEAAEVYNVQTTLIGSPSQIKVTGLGPLNDHVSFLEDAYKSAVSAGLPQVFNQELRQGLNRALRQAIWPSY